MTTEELEKMDNIHETNQNDKYVITYLSNLDN